MALEPCQKKCEKHRPPMMDLEGCGRREPKSVEADDVRSAAVRCVSSVGSGVKPRRAHNPKVFQVKSELARRSWSIRSARAPIDMPPGHRVGARRVARGGWAAP